MFHDVFIIMGWDVVSESKLDIEVTLVMKREKFWKVLTVLKDTEKDFYYSNEFHIPEDVVENDPKNCKENIDRDYTLDKSEREKRFDRKLLAAEITKTNSDKYVLEHKSDSFKDLDQFLSINGLPNKERIQKQIMENRDETEARINMDYRD